MQIVILDREKQYFLDNKKILKIDFLNEEIGKIIEIDKILFIKNDNETILGYPFIENKIISFEIIKQIKDNKKISLKFKRRKHHIKKKGHRQKYTVIKMIDLKNKE